MKSNRTVLALTLALFVMPAAQLRLAVSRVLSRSVGAEFIKINRLARASAQGD